MIGTVAKARVDRARHLARRRTIGRLQKVADHFEPMKSQQKRGKNSCHENFCDSDADAGRSFWIQLLSAGSTIKLQGVRGPATRLHEKLCRTDLQDRVPDVHEILREEIVKRVPWKDC
jgi:hypothetical protein